MMNSIEKIIEITIKDIWEKRIKEDYDCGWLLKEDTVKNALYYHLRNELGEVFEREDIRIFTEFTDGEFKGTHKRPDMVIARVDMDKNEKHWGNCTEGCLAVIEIKFKTGFAEKESIYNDYAKLEGYLSDLKLPRKCKLYMATIWECEDEPTNWVRKNAAWANGRLVELNASYIRNENRKMQFYTWPH